MTRLGEPLFTTVLPDVEQFRPRSGCLYISGTSVEERSEHIEKWERACENVCFARMTKADRSSAAFLIRGKVQEIGLRSRAAVQRFLDAGKYESYYLDVTGLPHHVWAPLLKGLMSRPEAIFCVYVEPGDYKLSDSPTEAAIFDLSEKIEGIAPLPGFATFPAATEEDPLFVPLLGFEGPRFAFMFENVQPTRENIVPVVGVPGFRPEYPFYTYVGNRTKLKETRAWQNVRYAAANCPFSLYYLLCEFADEWPKRRMVLGVIGTKPHAVGAVLYCLLHPQRAELLYDHPVRKASRTAGTSRVCVYDLTRFPRISV